LSHDGFLHRGKHQLAFQILFKPPVLILVLVLAAVFILGVGLRQGCSGKYEQGQYYADHE
jgi:hypothetical protein